jgi:hypothetical protein
MRRQYPQGAAVSASGAKEAGMVVAELKIIVFQETETS